MVVVAVVVVVVEVVVVVVIIVVVVSLGNSKQNLQSYYIYYYLRKFCLTPHEKDIKRNFSLMQNNLINIAELAEDPCLSEYEEKIISSERK